MYEKIRPLTLLALLMAFSGAVAADTEADLQALKEEVRALRQGQVQMQDDLAEIRKLLQEGARAAAPGAQAFAPQDTRIGDVAYIGDRNAPVTLIEYSDYQCPFCKRHATTVMPEIVKSYVEKGQLRFVMREFPIPNLHPRATAASEAALCAGDQDAYWGMHDLLFANQRAMTDEDFRGHAATLGLDTDAFADCLESDRHLARIRADQAEGRKHGVSGTPSFVLGRTDAEDPDKVRLSHFIRGAKDLASFTSAIDELLEQAGGERED